MPGNQTRGERIIIEIANCKELGDVQEAYKIYGKLNIACHPTLSLLWTIVLFCYSSTNLSPLLQSTESRQVKSPAS